MKRRNYIFALLASAILTIPSIASAQSGATVKLLVGFPAGGAPDTVARAFAEQVRKETGKTIVVENKPGASGKIAIDTLISAAADGQTLALIPASVLALVPVVVKAAKYDAVRDFTAVGNVAEYGFGIAAGPSSGAVDLKSYTAWAKKHPNESNFASPGIGTPQHFLGAQLEKMLNIQLTHVPYQGGAASLKDVLGGQIPLLITTEQLLVPHEEQGRLKTLFVTSRERNPRMPQVPTAKEVGLPELESTDWFGIFVKSGTEPAKVNSWRSLIAKVVSSPAYHTTLSNMGYAVPKQQPADFEQQVRQDQDAWAQRVKLSKFQIEE